ncbi:hypothetical protein ACU4GD_32350 [Cupriavidus basilensis]
MSTLIVICLDAGGTISSKKRRCATRTKFPKRISELSEEAVQEVLEDSEGDSDDRA